MPARPLKLMVSFKRSMTSPRVPGFRYVVAAMLLLATTINYADRLMLSVVSPQVRGELGMTEAITGRFCAGSWWPMPSCTPLRARLWTGWARAEASRCSSRYGPWRPWGTLSRAASGA